MEMTSVAPQISELLPLQGVLHDDSGSGVPLTVSPQ